MKKLLTALALLVSIPALSADFTITVKPAGKSVYYYSGTTKIGKASLAAGGIDTPQGLVAVQALIQPNASIYLNAGGIASVGLFIDAECKTPRLYAGDTNQVQAPIENSLLKVKNGWVRFKATTKIQLDEAQMYFIQNNNGTYTCSMSGSFTGEVWSADSFTPAPGISFPTDIRAVYE